MSTEGEERYKTGEGYVTAHSRRLFTDENPSVEAPSTLSAGKNGEPLFFWQLHSILGPKRIEAIVRKFYELVWKGEEWFKEAFLHTNDLEGHIWTQSAFWIDAMGGGRAYHGGHFRLSFHHSRVEQAMTRKGAIRWLELMRQALDDSDLTSDPRVRECISGFLELHMNKYGEQFEFLAEGLDYKIKPLAEKLPEADASNQAPASPPDADKQHKPALAALSLEDSQDIATKSNGAESAQSEGGGHEAKAVPAN
mmetsp:Transcript_15377/g.30358  ORF Transcript_15377/g.30358 Transcript_15377/m.30358 type:complete len:252 (-) Transcript_15377:83-838(-)|eukprot:CAMPEP_0173399334 /NCGR_PEP_ID=MMETSP1356-20130122/44624_1 /TAXON_ID=77927 ORGANISM="Hemiselmis virescens, Strain PCC157" /NCGR_SAMPLE_ID=MMETSP1356 /ASSEMBLY_ACC=CAM_ASM_000847 /LENGTH=251 /DNA_ID=CAMNT_0014359029 /DNA_START=137 /DNA_END=892 /DNA_ORIENTATION=+